MFGSLKSLVYAGALCMVCGLLLTAASNGLKPYQERNILIDRHRNILSAAGVLPIYLFLDGQNVQGYIVPIDTRGLWGPIQAYLAFDKDGATVKGFTVYQHAETPGLGGEIERKWFRDNWVGKKIVTRQGKFVSVGVAKGRVEDIIPKDKKEHYVDGISGATLTGKYLTAGLAETLRQYEPVAVKFRKNLLHELEGAAATR
jgi:Na+-transporting NADH:ubiquinone oxidoreductase subunit C